MEDMKKIAHNILSHLGKDVGTTGKKRRSNWYIYIVTFLITLGILSFFVWRYWDVIMPQRTYAAQSSGAIDYRPDESMNFTLLVMLAQTKGATPDYYMLMNYRPRDEKVVAIPFSQQTLVETETLRDMYEKGGAQRVMDGLKKLVSTECAGYIKFDKSSYIDFTNFVGDAVVSIPKAIDTDDFSFRPGTQNLSGKDLYNYITYNGFEQGEDYLYTVQASAACSIINENSRNLTTAQMQSYFNKLTDVTDTSLTFRFYAEHQQAFAYTSSNSMNIAEYYVPYGTTAEDGTFTLDANSLISIKDRLNIKE